MNWQDEVYDLVGFIPLPFGCGDQVGRCFLFGKWTIILQEWVWQGLNADTTGYEGYLTDRIVPFPAVNYKRKVTPLHGREMAMLGLKNLKTTLITKEFQHSFCFIGKQRQPIIVQREYGKIPYFTLTAERRYWTTWKEGEIPTDVYTDNWSPISANAKMKNRPFFGIWLRIRLPHWPLQVDEKILEKYERAAMMKA